MREIKFRAWSDGEDEQGIPYMIEMEDFNQVKFYEMLIDANGHGLKFMQFTGLTDNDGVDIYEGDIIKDKNGIIWTVHFLMGNFSIYCSSKQMAKAVKIKSENKTEEEEIADDLDAWWYGSEVLGNIYENPELLKDDVNAVKPEAEDGE